MSLPSTVITAVLAVASFAGFSLLLSSWCRGRARGRGRPSADASASASASPRQQQSTNLPNEKESSSSSSSRDSASASAAADMKHYTLDELALHNGSDPSRAILVGIDGKVYDVTSKRDMYGPGAGYNVFAGKDATRGLAIGSLKPEDMNVRVDRSQLDEKQRTTLQQWIDFFAKKYPVVGTC